MQVGWVDQFLQRVDWVSDRIGMSVPPVVDLGVLRSLPPGTLGHALVDTLNRHQLQPLTSGPRRKQLHDVVHVVTGYDTDPLGEAEVQAFLLGAKFSPIQIALGLGLLGIMIRRYRSLHYAPAASLQRLWMAYRRGQRSRLDIDTWQPELQWHWTVTQVQQWLRI